MHLVGRSCGLFVCLLAVLFYTRTTNGSVAGCLPCIVGLCGEAVWTSCGLTCMMVPPPAYIPCMVACAGVYCTPCIVACACYDQNTTVTLSNGKVSRMELLQPGDQVQTLNDDFQIINTAVTSLEVMEGNFEGVKIQTRKSSVTLTDQHQLRVFTAEDDFKITNASSVAMGDLMMRPTGFTPVVQISDEIIVKKILITTESCTILSNGILTKTC